MKKLRISFKLPITIVLLCSLAVGAMAYLAVGSSHRILEQQGQTRLSSIAQSTQSALLSRLDALRVSVVSQSSSPVFRDALTKFVGAFDAIPGEKFDQMRQRFVDENPHPAGERQMLDYVKGRDGYNRAHRKFHPYLRSLVEKNGYADLFLIDEHGNVLYSVMKNEDYAMNLLAEGNTPSGMTSAFQVAITAETAEPFSFVDYSDYALGDIATYSSFMATPVLASNGAPLGVLIVRLEQDALWSQEAALAGLGDTGSAFAAGQDGRLRMSTGQPVEADTLVEAGPVVQALTGSSGVIRNADTSGAEVLAAYEPFFFHGVTWAVVAQQRAAELFSDAEALKQMTVTRGAGLMVIAALIAFLFARGLTRPLNSVRNAMVEVSEGNLSSDVPQTGRGDEIGDIASTLESFRVSLIDARQTEERAGVLSCALEAASANLMIVGEDMTILHSNDAMKRLLSELSLASSDVDLANLSQVLSGKDATRVAQALDTAKTEAVSVDMSIANWRITLVIRPMDSDRNAQGAVVEWIDRTAEFRKTALIGSIEQRQCLLEFDLDGRVNGSNELVQTLLQFNEAELHQQKMDEMIVINPAKVTHPGGFLAGILDAGVVRGQYQVKSGTGGTVWIDGGISVVADGTGAPISLVMIGNDVSKTRAVLEANRKADAEKAAAQRQVVADLGAALSVLSEGDLTARIDNPFEAEYEQLRQDFNKAIESLSDTMRRLIESTAEIKNGSSSISASGNDLRDRATDQAQTFAQTAQDLSELATSVAAAAERAQTTSSIVTETREGMVASGTVMEQAVAAMGAIEENSKEIFNITKLIEDIAFQTNLLALNAGVEAARAGEAGRGFAVVATEVRALSQRSSDAASKINDVIQQANAEIQRGSDLVTQAGTALEQSLGSVKGISENVGEIAGSSVSHSKHLAQIDAALKDLDGVTRRNAKLLAEAAQTGNALKDEAEALAWMGSRFTVRPEESGTSKDDLPTASGW